MASILQTSCLMTARLSALLMALTLLGSCESGIPPSGDSPPPGTEATFLVVGNPGGLNSSELAVRDRLSSTGHHVTIVDDDRLTTPSACELVVLSKTSQSEKIGTKLKSVRCGVIFWEDNQQMLGQLATIDNDGSQGTGWHSVRTTVIVAAGAPSELRAGHSGTIEFYTRPDEITWAPDGDLPGAATVVALLGDPTRGRTAIYIYEEGDLLADGSPAAGRRVYFGLYDDTFVLLTPAGLALFDAVVAWAGL